uniref:U3 small nucleolar RNA-associated protein 25 homolog n=1 Tax=Strigamia maritima TaxID=126957 RepID=T1IPY6_STRMM
MADVSAQRGLSKPSKRKTIQIDESKDEKKKKRMRKAKAVAKNDLKEITDTAVINLQEIDNDSDDAEPEEEVDIDDPFKHFTKDIEESLITELSTRQKWNTQAEETVALLGKAVAHSCRNAIHLNRDTTENLYLKKQLLDSLKSTRKTESAFTDFQSAFYSIINKYHDVYYPERSCSNAEELRTAYCVHALNHILKTRSKIVHHNSKIKRHDDVPDEYRDQGLTRPKVLILVPFRESALRVVKLIMDLISPDKKANIINKKRFQSEFNAEGPPVERMRKRPDDYEATFVGNTDDMFRLGIGITKKSLKLYADFYSADILVASPLGLRTIIGAEGEKQDFDFLSSIEVFIMDQCDVFLMQNWSHILYILKHMHLQPSESHGVDFSRVRMWTLNGWAKFYRQTIILSGVRNPSFSSLFNKHCFNYAGKVEFRNLNSLGTICQVVAQLPQVFHAFSAPNASELADFRFQFFISKILPQFKDAVMSHTMIFIPSYFDFVRIRNYFKKESISFVQICEYSKQNKVARARDYFFHGTNHFLLYTERAHFYNRYVIKGIRHIIFYEVPIFAHFYSEMCNMLQLPNSKSSNEEENDKSDKSCLVLYASQDVQQLSAVVGSNRTSLMLNSDRKVHMFVSGE